jgi:hypothetical protein
MPKIKHMIFQTQSLGPEVFSSLPGFTIIISTHSTQYHLPEVANNLHNMLRMTEI